MSGTCGNGGAGRGVMPRSYDGGVGAEVPGTVLQAATMMAKHGMMRAIRMEQKVFKLGGRTVGERAHATVQFIDQPRVRGLYSPPKRAARHED